MESRLTRIKQLKKDKSVLESLEREIESYSFELGDWARALAGLCFIGLSLAAFIMGPEDSGGGSYGGMALMIAVMILTPLCLRVSSVEASLRGSGGNFRAAPEKALGRAIRALSPEGAGFIRAKLARAEGGPLLGADVRRALAWTEEPISKEASALAAQRQRRAAGL